MSSGEDGGVVATKRQAVTLHSTLDFESPSLWQTSSGSLSAATQVFSGTGALAANLTGYAEITSVPISSLGPVGEQLSIRIRPASTPSWGELRIIVKVPSLQEHWRDLGGVQIAQLAADEFHHLTFAVPQDLREKLAGTYSDLTFTIVVNGPAGNYVLDTLLIAASQGTGGGPVLPIFEVHQQALDAKALLAASEWLEVGDRVQLLAQGGGFGTIGNTGSGITKVGSDAQVGSVWAEGPVDLRDRAQVSGSVFADSVTTGNDVVISGSVSNDPRGSTRSMTGIPEEFDAFNGDIDLQPGMDETLPPGHYGTVVVKPGATLRLHSGGHYRFNSFTAESNAATIELTTSCEPIFVHVTDHFIQRGTINETSAGEKLGMIVIYDGSSTAHVESPFRGAILAPNSELILNSATHIGRFMAKRLRVQADAIIQDVLPPEQVLASCTIPAPEQIPGPAIPQPRPHGPAPTLTGPGDLPTFMEWFYFMRREHFAEARSAIVGVANQATLVAAAAAMYESHKNDVTQGLMDLLFIAAIPHADAETYLTSMLSQPLSLPTTEEQAEVFDREISFRSHAMRLLLDRGSAAGETAIRSIALGHPIQRYRASAISRLKLGRSEAYISQLRSEVHPEDLYVVDRPDRSDENFAEKLQTYRATWGN